MNAVIYRCLKCRQFGVIEGDVFPLGVVYVCTSRERYLAEMDHRERFPLCKPNPETDLELDAEWPWGMNEYLMQRDEVRKCQAFVKHGTR